MTASHIIKDDAFSRFWKLIAYFGGLSNASRRREGYRLWQTRWSGMSFDGPVGAAFKSELMFPGDISH
jgi:hypothetical protein